MIKTVAAAFGGEIQDEESQSDVPRNSQEALNAKTVYDGYDSLPLGIGYETIE